MLHRKHQTNGPDPEEATMNTQKPLSGKNAAASSKAEAKSLLSILIPSNRTALVASSPNLVQQDQHPRRQSLASPLTTNLKKNIANVLKSPSISTLKKLSNEFNMDELLEQEAQNLLKDRIPTRARTSPSSSPHSSPPLSPSLPPTGSQAVKQNNVIIIASILLWYIFSVSISVYNKWMFSPKTHFSFPILITSCHQFILFLLSGSVLVFNKRFRLKKNSLQQSYWMNWKTYLLQIVPCSISSLLDIGLGNFSFKFITLSLYTMIKSSLIVFVLLWGVIFKLEKLSLRLCVIVFIMTIGVTMMVQGQHEPHHHLVYPGNDSKEAHPGAGLVTRIGKRNSSAHSAQLEANKLFIGCFLVLSSACMSGLRWALTQILLKKNSYTKNPILTIFYLSPSMCLFLVVVGGFIEGWVDFFSAPIWEEKGSLVTIILLIIPGLLLFLMTLSEFTLLQHLPLLTLSIAGIFKELLTICVSSIIFGDRLNFINVVGLILTLIDIMWYNFYRYQEQQQANASDHYTKLHQGPVPSRTPSNATTNFNSPTVGELIELRSV